MSNNRNTKSKSPQIIKQTNNIDKDLMKYHLLQNINKPQGPVKQIVTTQPDEEQELLDFKQEIEFKYKNSQINHTFIFPKYDYDSSSDNSLQSLKDTTIYNLNYNNINSLTDATSSHFMTALNKKLFKLTDLIEPNSSQITIQNLNTSIPKKINQQTAHNLNQSSTSIRRLVDHNIININPITQNVNLNRDSVTNKTQKNQYFRATPTISSEKKKQTKQILQILKVVQQSKIINNNNNNTFNKRKTHINSYSINNTNNKLLNYQNNAENIRIQTQQDVFEQNIQQFQIIRKSRQAQVSDNITKFKKLESSQECKILNRTMDNHLLEQLVVERYAKSQNRSYKV